VAAETATPPSSEPTKTTPDGKTASNAVKTTAAEATRLEEEAATKKTDLEIAKRRVARTEADIAAAEERRNAANEQLVAALSAPPLEDPVGSSTRKEADANVENARRAKETVETVLRLYRARLVEDQKKARGRDASAHGRFEESFRQEAGGGTRAESRLRGETRAGGQDARRREGSREGAPRLDSEVRALCEHGADGARGLGAVPFVTVIRGRSS